MVQGRCERGVLGSWEVHRLVDDLVLDDGLRFGSPLGNRLDTNPCSGEVVVEGELALDVPLGVSVRGVEGRSLRLGEEADTGRDVDCAVVEGTKFREENQLRPFDGRREISDSPPGR